MPEDGAEATFAPGQDLSLESTEMLLEEIGRASCRERV